MPSFAAVRVSPIRHVLPANRLPGSRDERAGRRLARARGGRGTVEPSDVRKPDYFHKVVDCQWACPAHTNVPEYIRLIAQGRYRTRTCSTGSRTCSRASWADVRSALRAGLPADARGREAGRDLPAQACRRRPARRHHRPLAQGAGAARTASASRASAPAPLRSRSPTISLRSATRSRSSRSSRSRAG